MTKAITLDVITELTRDEISAAIVKQLKKSPNVKGFGVVMGPIYDVSGLVLAHVDLGDLELLKRSEKTYHRYMVDEWKHWNYKAFPKSNTAIVKLQKSFKSKHSHKGDEFFLDADETAHSNSIYKSVVNGVKLAKRQLCLDEMYMVVWVPDTGESIIKKSIRALNSKAIAARALKLF